MTFPQKRQTIGIRKMGRFNWDGQFNPEILVEQIKVFHSQIRIDLLRMID
jgi:hypothetical protein